MDIANLAPELAALIHVQPSTLVLLLVLITGAANRAARLIPNDATGFWGGVRIVCAILGAHVSSRVTTGVTVDDVAAAALDTPPITEKAAEQHAGQEMTAPVDAAQTASRFKGGL